FPGGDRAARGAHGLVPHPGRLVVAVVPAAPPADDAAGRGCRLRGGGARYVPTRHRLRAAVVDAAVDVGDARHVFVAQRAAGMAGLVQAQSDGGDHRRLPHRSGAERDARCAAPGILRGRHRRRVGGVLAAVPLHLTILCRRALIMANDIAVHMEGVWKRYGLPLPRWLTRDGAWGAARASAAPGADARPWVLQDINLEVRRGETVAIVGRNGAAKSTLLKILAGVTPATRGRVDVHGRVFPMIEITGGLHQELTGRENIRLIGTILGVPRRELTALLPEIEAFIDLGTWIDQPIRTYSTGMLARLGFGGGACIQSDVVLIDEALAVGDLSFQNKSLARIKRMHERGAAIVLVTHSLDTAQFIAQRGIVLDEGRIVATGSSVEALRAYERLVF